MNQQNFDTAVVAHEEGKYLCVLNCPVDNWGCYLPYRMIHAIKGQIGFGEDWDDLEDGHQGEGFAIFAQQSDAFEFAQRHASHVFTTC